jgi:hypothetical protein
MYEEVDRKSRDCEIIDVRRTNRRVILLAARLLSGVSETTSFYYLRMAQYGQKGPVS